MKYCRQRLALWVLLLILPATALANAGTAMMWVRAGHLFVGNAVIGLCEGSAFALVLRLSLIRTIAIVILANYASAWAGLYAVNYIAPQVPFTLENTQDCVMSLILFTFALTLVVEAPFFIWWIWGRDRSRWLSGFLFVGVQVVSYLFMFERYAAVSPRSLFRDHEWVPLASITIPDDVRLYYIDAGDGDVYTRLPADGEAGKVADLNITNVEDRIQVRAPLKSTGKFDLVLHRWRMDIRQYEMVKSDIARIAATDRFGADPEPRYTTNAWSFGPVPKLGGTEKSEWRWDVGYWAGEGMHGYRERDGAKIRYAYETPFVEWVIRNATHLPGDLLLFQVGDEDVCIADPARRVIARVCKGRSPVAVIAE
jgi:hypothetical protein